MTRSGLVRAVTPDDVDALLALVHDLAAYERAPDAVQMTAPMLKAALFAPAPLAHAVLVDHQGSIAGFALYFTSFSAIINPPQGAIIAIGAGEQRPVVRGSELAIATVMTVTLSCDHRVIDGATGAEFLAALKALIEAPLGLML